MTSSLSQTTLPLPEIRRIVEDYFRPTGISAENMNPAVEALLQAEIDGQRGHGLMRVPFYAAQIRSGKVNGLSTPAINNPTPTITLIDNQHGLAFRPLEEGIRHCLPIAEKYGIAMLSVRRTHHAGMLGYWAERAARAGLVALVFSNTPAAIAPWGGKKALFGTNPIAFAAPLRDADPLVIDLSLSISARGKVMAAKQAGTPLPPGIALDKDGNPTTNPDAALAGTMVPIAEAKGYALVLMVEIFSAVLSGAQFSFEASSFFEDEGPPPAIGQCAIFFHPTTITSSFEGPLTYMSRIKLLIDTILADPNSNVRLPGSSKLARRSLAAKSGISIPNPLLKTLRSL